MNHIFTQFAEAPAKSDLFGSIGIDWKLLLLQTIAFLILFWFLKKYVYPPIVAMLDKHDDQVNAAYNAAKEAAKNAEVAEAKVAGMLKEARAEAKDIVATAKEEATTMVSDAESAAKTQAEHIVANAHDDIAREVLAAKKALHNETIDLVAAATEKVVGKVVDAKMDTKVISSALEEAK